VQCPNEGENFRITAARPATRFNAESDANSERGLVQRGIKAARGNQLLVNKSDKMGAGNPQSVRPGF
jgi:hypothetical protein